MSKNDDLIELTKSQQTVIILARTLANQKLQIAKEASEELQNIINTVAEELGIGLAEKWNLSKDGRYFRRPDLPNKEDKK